MLFVILVSTVILILLYVMFLKPLSYWKSLGVSQPTAWTHIYFNWFLFMRKQSAAHMVQIMYNAVPNVRYFGLHQFNMPALVIKDPELLKQITIKHFDHFTDHRFLIPEAIDPVIGKSLVSLNGQKWRVMRNILSPTFTSSKMKTLYHLIIDCAERFVTFFEEQNEDLHTLEMQDTFSRYTNDVIASVIFGIEINSLKDRNNEFYVREKRLTDLTGFSKGLKFILALVLPRLYQFLNLRLFEPESVDFFRKLVEQSIKLREENVLKRADMIHLLLEAKNENNEEINGKKSSDSSETNEQQKPTKVITVDDIVAQVFVFFFAGFESSSRFMCFAAHELAVNQDIQHKMREEIKDTIERCQGKLTYEALTGMKYMDSVLSEVLRKYPTQIGTDRVCTKPFVLEPELEGEKPLLITPGTCLSLPTYGMHHDPELFPEPDRFDPDRFSEENKKSVPQYAYHPFGLGPRSCIGNRFALLESKALFFFLLSKFEIVPVEKTKIPLVFLKSMFSFSSEGGFWLGLKRLKETEL